MKQYLRLSLIAIFITSSITAQNLQPVVKIDGHVGCGTDAIHRDLLSSNATYQQKHEDFETLIKNNGYQSSLRASTIYKIPVVVHIMHLGEASGAGTNLSDKQVKNGIDRLNQQFRKTAGGIGDGAGVDVEIEFALAVRDPNGNCTNGIVRTDLSGDSDYANYGIKHSGSNGILDANLKALSRWNPTNYYNIYLVYKIDGDNCTDNSGSFTGGYAYFASSHGDAADGMIMLSCSYVKTTSSTLAHELGHSLNLYHTFQGDASGTSCPDPAGDGDFCDDTPRHIRYSEHPENSNQYNNCAYAGTNNCDAGSTQDHMHNYMDYTFQACTNQFTADQKTRMVTALTSVRSSFLENNGNLSLTPPTVASVGFSTSLTAVCTGSSITFTDESFCSPNTYTTSGFTGITYLWTFDNGVDVPITSTLQNPTITFNANGLYDVTLAITNVSGTSSQTKTELCAVTGSATVACTPPVSPNEGNFGYVVYNVRFNDIDNSTSTSTNVSYTDYSCSASTIVKSGDTYALSVDIAAGNSENENVEVYIDWNDNGLFEAGELLLSGNVDSGSVKNVTANIVIPPTAVKNKLLRMRVYAEAKDLSADDKACISTMFVPDVEDYGVYVLAASVTPVTDFSGSVTSVCAGNSITFSDLSTNSPSSWSWSFEGGAPTTSTSQNPTITYNTAGTFSVSLTASNSAGSDSESKIAYISVTGFPNAGAITGLSTTCQNDDGVTYSITAVTGATSYAWTVAAGMSIASGQGSNSITVDMGASAGGNITVVPSNACGNGSDASIAVTVDLCPAATTPVADFSAASTTICMGDSIVFSDLSTNTPTSWTWTFEGGATTASTTQNPTITYNSVGTFSVSLTAGNVAGNDTESKTTYISIVDVPSPSGAIAGLATVCENDKGLTYSIVAVSGANSYLWTVPAGMSLISGQGTNSIIVDVGASAGGNINAVPINDCGFGSGSSTIIVVDPCIISLNPVADFSAVATEGCVGGSIAFTDLSTNTPTSWNWVFEGGSGYTATDQNPTVTYATAGTYSVSLTASNSGGSDIESKMAYITITDVPADAGLISGLTAVCSSARGLIFSIDPVIGATSYLWLVPLNATIASGQGTNSIVLDMGAATGGSLAVIPKNACGDGGNTGLSLLVNPCITIVPVADFSMSTTTVCVGDSISYSDLSTETPTSWTWTFEGGTPAASNEQNPTVTYDIVGSHAVELIAGNAGGSSNASSNTIGVGACPELPNSISVDGVADAITSIVYPNPTNNIAFINLGNVTSVSMLTLYNAYGNTLFKTSNFGASIVPIDLSKFSAGIYTLQVNRTNTVEVIKVVKQ